eukprot:s1240_g5.t1
MFCTDACLSGYAVMSSCQGESIVREIGQNDERGHFKLGEGYVNAPRRQALDTAGVFSDSLTVLPEVDGEVPRPVEIAPTFPDVLPEVMEDSRWSRTWCTPVHYKEPVHMIEARTRSILGAVKHIVRDSRSHGKKHVILNDNVGVVLAMQKGRCCDFGLLRVVRRVSAHLLASGNRVHVRWIPSEMNAADRESRLWEPETKTARAPGIFGTPDFRSLSRCHVSAGGCQAKGRSAHQGGGQGDESAADHRGSQHVPTAVSTIAEAFTDEEWTHLPKVELRDLVATHKKRKEKAVQRRRKYEMRLRATRREQGLLEMHSIKEPQRRDYLQKLDGFYSFIAQYELPTTTEGQLDAALCEYADLLYLDGCGSRRETDGGHRIHPAGVRSGRHFASSPPPALVERLETTRTESGENAAGRIPEIRCELVDEAMKKKDMALFNDVLILDDVRATFLPELLHHLAKQRIKAEGMEAGLWTFNAKDYLSVWRTCVSTLGIEGLAMSPYQTRHGGASRDDLMGLRTIPEIRRRGRWASDSSARICDKPGGLQQMSSMYEGRYRELGEKIRLNFANFYHNGGVEFVWADLCDSQELMIFEVSGGGRSGPFRDHFLSMTRQGPMPLYVQLMEEPTIGSPGVWSYELRSHGELAYSGKWWATRYPGLPGRPRLVSWEQLLRWLQDSGSECRDEDFLPPDMSRPLATIQALRQHRCLPSALSMPFPKSQRCLVLASLANSVNTGGNMWQEHLRFFRHFRFVPEVEDAAAKLLSPADLPGGEAKVLRSPYLAIHMRAHLFRWEGFNQTATERIFVNTVRGAVLSMSKQRGRVPDVFLATESMEENHSVRVRELLVDGFGARVLTSQDAEAIDLKVDLVQSNHTAQSNHTSLSGSSLVDAIVKTLQTMQAIRPDVIRAARAHTMLRRFGRAFRGNAEGLHEVSFAAEKIDEFWSHSWQTSAWMKVCTLWFVNNGYAAAVVGMICAVVACILCLLEVLPLQLAAGVRYPWCALFGTLGYCPTLLFWRRRSKVFLDVVCIDQEDEEFKAMALVSIPAILQRSEGMLVVWDATRGPNQKVKLLIRPIILGPCLLAVTAGLLVATLAFSIHFTDDHAENWQSTLGVVLIVASFCLLVSTHLIRVFCRSIDTLQKQLENFRVEDTRCACCECNHIRVGTGEPMMCDRKVLYEVIISWFGSIEKFEEEVRGPVRTTLLRQIFNVRLVYFQLCAVASCVLWYYMDRAVWDVAYGPFGVKEGLLAGLRSLVWWLALEPSVFILGVGLCWLFRNRCSKYLALDVYVTANLMSFPSIVLIGLVLLEVLLDPGTSIQGGLVFAAALACVVVGSWYFVCRCFPR